MSEKTQQQEAEDFVNRFDPESNEVRAALQCMSDLEVRELTKELNESSYSSSGRVRDLLTVIVRRYRINLYCGRISWLAEKLQELPAQQPGSEPTNK